ncbi:hypothetical protein FKM82_019907 [Ascaphus truei]
MREPLRVALWASHRVVSDETLPTFSEKNSVILSPTFLCMSGIFSSSSLSLQFAPGLFSKFREHRSSMGAWSDHEISWIPEWETTGTNLLDTRK